MRPVLAAGSVWSASASRRSTTSSLGMQEIGFATSPVRLRGSGTADAGGREPGAARQDLGRGGYWFWARRVLRKLRFGIRRARQSGAPPPGGGTTPVFILVRPQLADNIGMVARALANFGIEELRLVAPRDGWPNEKARIAASGANFIVDAAQSYPTLNKGLGGLNWVAATSARQRDLAKPVLTPEQAVAEMRRRMADGQRCGILFGPERNGLETEEVANADAATLSLTVRRHPEVCPPLLADPENRDGRIHPREVALRGERVHRPLGYETVGEALLEIKARITILDRRYETNECVRFGKLCEQVVS